MADVIINVEGLGKSYRLRHQRQQGYISLRDVLGEKARAAGRRLIGRKGGVPAGDEEEFWALRDISFNVRRGEVIGIIGRNGAGKSTLLKILSRITEPTEGRVRCRGRVASLLEVGTGFHPELSGRENIFLNGAILGMSRAEIRRKFDEIVAFAEVEKFLDTPVKRYSSGMYVRLAFSVAAHLEPEILIIDEVLAVGDAGFQKRCLGKMKDVTSMDGRTVLFVSHNMAAVQSLCTTTLRLVDGRLGGIGDSSMQIELYLADVLEKSTHANFSKRNLSDTLVLDVLEITPRPLQTGQNAQFRVQLSSRTNTCMKELCILVYSPVIGRVAILDLRNDADGYHFGPGKPLVLTGEIESIQFVEGEYTIGLYINCGDVHCNFLDLSVLAISHPDNPGALSPYAPHDRGIIELVYQFERQ